MPFWGASPSRRPLLVSTDSSSQRQKEYVSYSVPPSSSGARRGAPDGVAMLKKGSKVAAPSGPPLEALIKQVLHGRVRKISPKFSCIKFFQIRDVPTQIAGHPGHSLSKATEKGHLHKVFVRDIPTSGSGMSQEYPAQKLFMFRLFFRT